MEPGIVIGDKIKDSLTGATGTVTARVNYQFDTPQLLVVMDEAGGPKALEGVWLPMARVTRIEEGA